MARARKSAKREQKSTMDDLAALLKEMLARSGGPMTAAERRAADKVLTGRRRRA